MREFMEFCLTVLTALVDMLFQFDVGGYTYGDFIVVTLLVSVLVGALVIRFHTPSSSAFVPRPPRHGSGGGSSDAD